MSHILVTGGSRGIGAATVRRLLADGHNVAATYNRHPGALNALHADPVAGDRLLALQADFHDPKAVACCYHRAVEHFGALDGLVNNAGIMPLVDASADQDTWDAAWADTLQVNVKAAADLCRLFIRDQQGAQRRIVSIASRAAYRGDGIDAVHYAASKAAVVALMKSIARGYAPDGVLAFTIAPGWVKTDMASVAFEPGNEHMLADIPLGRAADADEIAEMTALLLSGKLDSATGTVIDINGASYVR